MLAASTRRNESDLSAWPSSYYGRTRRIDLAKLYSETLRLARVDQQQQQQQQQKPLPPHPPTRKMTHNNHGGARSSTKTRRKVSFTTEPPKVHEYEPEENNEIEQQQSSLSPGKGFMQSCRRFDHEGHLRLQTVDLRPIPNRGWCPALSLVDEQQHDKHGVNKMERVTRPS
ncbi:predicted protein [Lichtheimia corymbifera JMRC:FSU:9682]|uniref:Uncharacterized protein n=1 Tax=Lichtheimia corymbifera JMRC:FSU:9682 TaxID=1263082 RepID=A0A068RE43_9FUNG|nr:predicted protein [Lichtheimia corymbifera JMRC:FSU:9682]